MADSQMNAVRTDRLPDFYVIGAPRCGTTAIYETLQRQPRIFVPLKEPRYWCDDLDSGSAADGLFFMRRFEDYAALYAPASEDQVVGDMSTWYLFSQNAVPRILSATPNARFILGVRNPVDLMRSLHAMRLASLAEDIVDFRAALEAEEDRLHGRRIPPNVRNRSGLLYRRVASTGSQLRRLVAQVAKHQIYVYAFEDLREDPHAVVNGILQFLELPRLSPTEPIPVLNRRPEIRLPRLRAAVMAPRTVIWAKKFVPPSVRGPIRWLVDTATRRDATIVPMGDHAALELLESFRLDIDSVSEITGRDMWSLWSRELNPLVTHAGAR